MGEGEFKVKRPRKTPKRYNRRSDLDRDCERLAHQRNVNRALLQLLTIQMMGTSQADFTQSLDESRRMDVSKSRTK